VQAAPGQGDRVGATPVSRGTDSAPAEVGAADGARIRGRIVPHLPSMSDPDATAAGDPPVIPPPAPRPGADASPADAAPTSSWPPPPGAVTSNGATRRRRRRRWPIVFAALVFLVVVAGFIAARISVDYYVITPGDASNVSQYIEVPAAQNHPLTGKILLTDVYVSQLNALGYLQYKYFGSSDQIYSGSDLLGGAPSQGQFLNQGFLQMAQAQSFATASALTYLGYTVTSTNAGALVYGIEPHSPASGTLQLGQVIQAIDGMPTATECALVGALHGLLPGAKASLTVEDSSINDVGTLVPGPVVQKSVTLGVPPKGLVETGCGPPTKPTAFLGIDPQTQQDWHFPVDVKINTPQIGGPSAGLAMTLGIIDKLSSGKLTGHQVIAATGTIDQYGNVGQVGGVPEKTIAVERAGASVFFVPQPELSQAKAKATPQLRVYGVNTLDQALQILKHLGGNVPPKPAPA
jgi:Lon-like protease